jgi:hypothetical protein
MAGCGSRQRRQGGGPSCCSKRDGNWSHAAAVAACITPASQAPQQGSGTLCVHKRSIRQCGQSEAFAIVRHEQGSWRCENRDGRPSLPRPRVGSRLRPIARPDRLQSNSFWCLGISQCPRQGWAPRRKSKGVLAAACRIVCSARFSPTAPESRGHPGRAPRHGSGAT